MKTLLLIWIGKTVTFASRLLGLGNGSTWPGHIALQIDPQILHKLSLQITNGIILIAGTNGKTTTVKIIKTILEDKTKKISLNKIISNESGANLINGVVSSLINKCSWLGKIQATWAIFEVDEATLPIILEKLNPKFIIFLNLFRDQLDRYGEIDIIANNWQRALKSLPSESTLILNADDPHVAFLGNNLKAKVIYFGLNDKSFFLNDMEHAVDSIYCPNCGQKLNYSGFFFSHLGHWYCLNCGNTRPAVDLSSWTYPLPGTYNRYNTLAAVCLTKAIGIKDKDINKKLTNFKPAFGRQEEIETDDKNIKIILSKNPAGFNESMRVLNDLPGKKKTILLVLNDRIPDGLDVSWIWDVDFEIIPANSEIIISGDRAFDLGLRIKYTQDKIPNLIPSNESSDLRSRQFQIIDNLKTAIREGLKRISEGESLYMLPTYSAMLEARKIITGKKIL